MSAPGTAVLAALAGAATAGAVARWHQRRQASLLRHPRGITQAAGLTRRESLTMAQLSSVPRWPTTPKEVNQ